MPDWPLRRSLSRRAVHAALLALACISVGRIGLAQAPGEAAAASQASASKLLSEARRCQRIAGERAHTDDECCVDWYFEAGYRASQAARAAGKGDELVAEANLL